MSKVFNMVGGGGKNISSIIITGLESTDTVTCTKDGKSYTAIWDDTDQHWEIVGLPLGTYTITATNGTETRTKTVLIDITGVYEIEISYPRWLYKDGNQYEDLTGGFVQTTTGDYYGYKFTGIVNFNTTSIYVSVDSTGNELPFVNTVNKIDFSNYSKIKVEYSFATSGSRDSTRKVTIWLTSEIGKDSMQNYQKLYEQIPDGSGTLEIDISAVNTSYYFVIAADSNPGVHATINKVWVE